MASIWQGVRKLKQALYACEPLAKYLLTPWVELAKSIARFQLML